MLSRTWATQTRSCLTALTRSVRFVGCPKRGCSTSRYSHGPAGSADTCALRNKAEFARTGQTGSRERHKEGRSTDFQLPGDRSFLQVIARTGLVVMARCFNCSNAPTELRTCVSFLFF